MRKQQKPTYTISSASDPINHEDFVNEQLADIKHELKNINSKIDCLPWIFCGAALIVLILMAVIM